MERIMVTGATSMIGVALIEKCIEENVEVYAIIRPNSNRIDRLPKDSRIHLIESELDDLKHIHLDVNCDVFYHLAWAFTSKESRNDPDLQEKNIQYSLDAVRLAHRVGCKKFIGAGSQAEYGHKSGVITSLSSVDPVIAYGIAKYAASKLTSLLCKNLGMIHVWGRIFSVYGINDNPDTMIDYALKQFASGNVAKFSSATQKWNYLNEYDAGRMFYYLGERAEKSKVYCIGNFQSIPLREYIYIMRDIWGDDARIEFADESDNSNQYSICPDISDFIYEIGYRPVVSFEEGIRRIINNVRGK